MSSRMIKRHSLSGIVIHWFNALCWLFLMATGLALIENPDLSPLPAGYAQHLRGAFGGGSRLLLWHWGAGAFWAAGWLVFIVLNLKSHVLPFLKDLATFRLPADLHWLIKKNFQMTAGYKIMGRLVKPLGLDATIPDQGYYNAGQKLAAHGFIAGGLALLATGAVMVASKYLLGPELVWLVQWSIFVHYLAAGVTFGLFLLHVYMAAISKEERPALVSMFTGSVPERYARHHHKLWCDQVVDQKTA